MLLQNIILPGVVYPLIAAIIGVLLSLFTAQRGTSNRSGGALTVGASFGVGFVALNGWPRLPPVEATQRLFVIVTAFALLAYVFSLFRPPEGPRKITFAPRDRPASLAGPLILFVVCCGLMLPAALEAMIRHTWTALQAALWLGGLLVYGVVLWLVLRRHLLVAVEPQPLFPGERDGMVRIALRLATFAGLAATFGLADSALLGQVMGAAFVGIAVVDVAGWFTHRRMWRFADLSLLALLVVGLGAIAHHYAGLTTWPALLAAAALLLLPPTSAPTWRGLLPVAALAVAITLLVWSKSNEPDPYDYYGLGPARVEHEAA